MRPLEVDPEETVFDVDISGLPPMIAKPHSPSNTVPITEISELGVDYVFVGSCTNSRLEDIAEVARIFAGNKVAPGVHCLVTPGSKQVYLKALELGYIETITRAGGIVTPPGCGACLGTQGSIPADGDRVVSTMNRNFLGRMGNRKSENYLASPLVAAHSAILGHMPAMEELV
jgi:3-isopropylmalate/(R)-2-methylmalate dehydratase large subunit